MASYGSFLQGIKPPKVLKPKAYKAPAKTISQHGPWVPRPGTALGGGGRLPPVPPVRPPVVPPAKPNFNDWYKTDPRYLLQHPQFDAARSGTYAEYGWHPILDAAGKPILDAQGKPTYRQASSGEDPFSIVNQLSQALAGKSQQIGDSANSRGLLFSGAMAQGQQNAATDTDRQLSDAQLAFQRALGGINTNESDLVNSLYPDYLAQAPPASTPAAAAAAAAAAPNAAAKEAERKARVKKAQDHLRQDKIDAAKKRRRRPPKKTTPTTPGGKSMTIGSNAGSVRGM